VSEIAGTTRDLVRERLDLDGLPVHVLDTAGLRAAHEAVQGGAVEEEGIRRARAAMERADRVLFVIDASVDPAGDAYEAERDRLPAGVPVTLVFNKSDLVTAAVMSGPSSLPPRSGTALGVARRSGGDAADPPAARSLPSLLVSAHTGAGMDALRAHLKSVVDHQSADAGTISARARHVEGLARAHRHVAEAQRQLGERRAGELVAEELRLALQALAEITGEFTNEDLLGRIFASFCIGK
jgi:tRNA modification GTPase